MFGWEFPPNNKGGLGTACLGLTKSLNKKGTEIVFVLPKYGTDHKHVNVIVTDNLYVGNEKIKFKTINSMLSAYMNESTYSTELESHQAKMMQGKSNVGELYGQNLFQEIERYANKANVIADFEEFDIIHCHDWMTFKAGINAKQKSGKPLVVHVHATDFDRTGGNPNQSVYNIEREGMHAADKIIAVSVHIK